VLGEEVSWRTLAGGALIMSGIALVVLRRTSRVEPVAAAESIAPEAEAAAGSET
jgi:drug/metabolite transporter (DMT)-like permease